jgi:hypothetical protein
MNVAWSCRVTYMSMTFSHQGIHIYYQSSNGRLIFFNTLNTTIWHPNRKLETLGIFLYHVLRQSFTSSAPAVM